jgi:hypothetical protein
LVDVAAGDFQRGVVPADCFLVRTFKQAIHFPFRIVVQLDLAYAELVGLRVGVFSAICARWPRRAASDPRESP